jgi:hypothetical protein
MGGTTLGPDTPSSNACNGALSTPANHIPSEMHIYAYGGHGFDLQPTKKPAPVMGAIGLPACRSDRAAW